MYYNYSNEEKHQRKMRRIRSVQQCLEEGMTDTKQIAEELGVSRQMIQRYIRYIRENQKE